MKTLEAKRKIIYSQYLMKYFHEEIRLKIRSKQSWKVTKKTLSIYIGDGCDIWLRKRLLLQTAGSFETVKEYASLSFPSDISSASSVAAGYCQRGDMLTGSLHFILPLIAFVLDTILLQNNFTRKLLRNILLENEGIFQLMFHTQKKSDYLQPTCPLSVVSRIFPY